MQDTTTSAFNKSKWNYRSPSVDKTALHNFAETQNAWSNNHMYRTSYHDMSDKVSYSFFQSIQSMHDKLQAVNSGYFILSTHFLSTDTNFFYS
jgi:hypothetical protein